jgi:hypothetical protein
MFRLSRSISGIGKTGMSAVVSDALKVGDLGGYFWTFARFRYSAVRTSFGATVVCDLDGAGLTVLSSPISSGATSVCEPTSPATNVPFWRKSLRFIIPSLGVP